MNFRNFGGTGPSVSEVGLGCWQLGGDWGDVDDYTAQKVLEAAVQNGINFYDTADVYGKGRSEALLHKYLRPLAPGAFIATKLGRFPEPGNSENYTFENFRRFTENSLKRLNIDALDLTQLHCIPTELMESGEVFEWLRELQKEGKIKKFGASVESISEAQTCLKQEGLASLQIIFNIFRQKPITELFDDAKTKGVSLIVRLPLASGLLGGKLNPNVSFPENDHRTFNSDGQCFNVGETFAGIPFNIGLDIVEELTKMIPEGMTLAQMSLRWILDFDAVTVVIPGSKS
ncbi:MAG: aldo/keto reductase, partial [Nitrospinales bacterium]|nr:aldo/keto reductase [Nitrospinales bacterium]